MQMSDGNTLSIDGVGDDGGLGTFGILPTAHEQLGLRLGIPKKFYERIRVEHPALLDTNVNTLMRENPERRMVRTLDGNARAVLSDRYRRLDYFELAQVIFPVIGDMPGAEIITSELTDKKMYLKVILPIEGEIKLNDPVQAGFIVSNSEVGHGSLSVETLIYRLRCLNGMIVPDASLRKYHVGARADTNEAAFAVFRDETIKADDHAFFLKVMDVVRAAADETRFNALVARLQDITETPKMADPVQAVERLGNRLSMNEGEQRSILTHLIEGGDLTAYGALNAITRTAQDVADFDRSVELERIGGQMLELPRADWLAIAA